jgi:cytochrome c-type biogenesis protein CcmF
MVPEYGHLALIIAFMLSVLLTVVPLVGTFTGRLLWMNSARPLAAGMFIFTLVSFLVLVYAFLQDDFTVKYVAGHSNTLLPVFYKVTAVWGGHEGSVLLWALVLAGWTVAVALFSSELPLRMLAWVLSVMGGISAGFLSFILFTSNPFDRLLPNPVKEGNDLNPLLQDIGMIIHPPILYMGYVGFSVCFAFAIAALIGGRLDSSWARWSRPWTNMAWVFQTLGIMLGSWWAYYELGWGGWWFWDPVENAAFMPWLVGTALVHSLAVTEKRGVFKSWTILLAIMAFSLSLLGTFIVRSGVLTSVHAFATDPARGMFILAFLGVVVGGSLLLYAIRIPEIRSVQGFGLFSRESFMLVNNVLFAVATAGVLFGTLYPLLVDALWGAKLSVGPPFFNVMFTPLMMLVALFVGFGIMMNWKKTKLGALRIWIGIPLMTAIIMGFLFPLLANAFHWGTVVAVALGSWVILASISDLVRKLRNSRPMWRGLPKISLSYWGMFIAHFGFAVCFIGAAVNSIESDHRDVRMVYGERQEIGGYEFELIDVVPKRGPNYNAQVGEVKVYRDGQQVTTLFPEKRHYLSDRGNVMTEAGIDAGFSRDLFVALGDHLDNRAWSMRIHHYPLVRWIWGGAIFMALGGMLAVLDRRYRMKRTRVERESDHSGVSVAT